MNLEEDFDREMRSIVENALNAGYNPIDFRCMLDQHGGVETAKRLLAVENPQSGLNRLWEMRMLDQSMEAKVVLERFRTLFTDEEIATARTRLEDRNYEFQERQ